jgi:hypothetical protein
MKVDKVSFEKFLDLIILDGDIKSKEAKITITPKGLEVASKLNGGICGIHALYSTDTKMDSDVEVGISDLIGFRKLFKSFKSSSISIEKKHNKFVISSDIDKHEISFVLDKAEYITIESPKDKIIPVIEKAKSNVIEISEDECKQIINIASNVDASIVKFEIVDHEINVKISKGNDREVSFKMDVGTDASDGSVSVSNAILSIMTSIKSGFLLGVNPNAPIYISTGNEFYTVRYVLAPFKPV